MRIADLFNIQGRFLRSAQLERDFRDPSALKGYVVTQHIQSNLDRITDGLDDNSGQRAWRITGDYGSGKSSFALLIAQLFSGRDSDIPPQLRSALDLTKVKRNRKVFFPVLITGSRESMALALTRALGKALDEYPDRRVKFTTLDKIKSALAVSSAINDSQAVQFVLEANSELIAKERAQGLLIILDELGKFLEFAALHPERQDVFLLQQLAEASTRSGREPLFVVGLLHQGFGAYSEQLSQSSKNEWDKVAARFDELVFDQPLDQILHLIGAALNISEGQTPRGVETRARTAIKSAIDLGWYGTGVSFSSVAKGAGRLYPLHPTLVPALVRLFSRFGQNERSLFSFLLSNEPFGLQNFALAQATPESFYRIHNLYDYAATTFGHHLSLQSYRNHWNYIDSLVRSFRSASEADLAVLKTVGLLNLIESPVIPTEDSIVLAIADDLISEDLVRKAINRLHKEAAVLYWRGRGGGYCLWSHTSINLDASQKEAGRAIGHTRKVATRIKEYLDARPIVARRHYIQTGNLRHFEVTYCSLTELERSSTVPIQNSDGRIVIPLCETPGEVQLATAIAESITDHPEILIGITDPLNSLESLVYEVDRWVWVQNNTPELKDDRYASEEVSRQLSSATQNLEKRVQHYAGLRQTTGLGAASMRWYYKGELQLVNSGKGFLSLLSTLCDRLYPNAPRIHNELVNRRSISSAAASARMKVIEKMLLASHQDYLGMDPAKKPPEMSIYLSVLRESKLHVCRNGQWLLNQPVVGKNDDPCNFAPAMAKVMDILESNPDGRFSAAHIFQELRSRPYGLRDGILPLILTHLLMHHQQELALYENGTFLSHVGSEEILRLSKAPGSYELQYCKVQGIRLTLFEKLLHILNPSHPDTTRMEILDVVRPLCVYVSELPQYTRNTKKLKPTTLAVRDAILAAREPGTLLFSELPKRLGYAPFRSDSIQNPPRTDLLSFVNDIKTVLDELRMDYPLLKDRIRKTIVEEFNSGSAPDQFQTFRSNLANRAEDMLLSIREMDLKAFCFRLMNASHQESAWIESVAAFIANVEPARWKDEDELLFNSRFREFAQKFFRVESLSYKATPRESQSSIRIALTRRDGSERDRVVHLTPDEESATARLEQSISSHLSTNKNVVVAAMSRIIWDMLEETK